MKRLNETAIKTVNRELASVRHPYQDFLKEQTDETKVQPPNSLLSSR